MKIMIAVAILLWLFVPTRTNAREASSALQVGQAYKPVTLVGYTRAKTTVTVSSEVGGRVIQAGYEVGGVTGEAPLYAIDPTFIEFEMAGARHALEKLAVMGRKSESQIAYLNKEFKRIDTLHKGDRATEARRDEAAERLAQARLELETIRVEQATMRTSLKVLEERLRRHTIDAPQGWAVVQKMVQRGEIVGTGTPLARIADFKELVVPLSLSAAEYEAIKALPDPFEVLLEGKAATASIHTINPEFNEQTRKLSVELILMDHPGEKRGGLAFQLPIRIAVEGRLVPREAVVSRYENPRVTLEDTGEVLNLIVLGEAGKDLIVAENEKLAIGTRLRIGTP